VGQGFSYDLYLIARVCTDTATEDPRTLAKMERNSNTKPKEHTTYLLKNIGGINDGKKLSSKHRTTTPDSDPMAEELRQMSLYSSKNDKPDTEHSRRWLTIDRSRTVGVDRPWDALAYVGTRKSNGLKINEHQQPHPRSTKSSSLDVERGSIM
jgi:hypothetical protein